MYVYILLAIPNWEYNVRVFLTQAINAAQAATHQASSGHTYLSTRAFPTKTYGSSEKSTVNFCLLLYYTFRLRA